MAGRVDHSHHLFGLHPPDGVFQGGELNEGKSSARTYIGMETTTNFKRGFIPIEPWLKTGGMGWNERVSERILYDRGRSS